MLKGGKGKHRGGKAADGGKSSEIIDGYAVSYVPRMTRCGKPNCKKCQTPGGGHGPYWYKIYRTQTGKVVTKYCGKVKPDQKTEAREEVNPVSKETTHVVPNPSGGWDVKKGGSKKATQHFDIKKDAVDRARQISKNKNSELIIHTKNGRIAQKDSHGKDPFPPKG